MSTSTHDSLFRRLFADRSIAADVIRGALPADVAAMLDLTQLELRPTAYVDESLRTFHSDLVFGAKLAGRDALVLLLVEHQSRPDERMPFRLLQYAVMAWDGYLRDHPRAAKLPLIVPLVLLQGPGEWRAPRDMLAMIDLTADEAAALGRYVPRMGFEIDELGATHDADRLARGMGPVATLALSALRDVRTASDVPALLARWGELLRAASATPSGTRALGTVLRYILQVHSGLDLEELARVADSVLTGAGVEVMTTAQQLMDIGEAKGKAEGKAEGRLEGRRATLHHQLRLKFRHAVTEAASARIEAAGEAELAQLEERILVASSIAELLG